MVVISRYAGLAGLGEFSLAAAVSAPVFLYCGLGLRSFASSDIRRTFTIDEYLTTRAVGVTAAIGITGAVWAVWFTHHSPLLLLFVLAAKGTEAFSDMAYGLLYRHHRPDLVGRSLALRGATAIAAAWLIGRSLHTATSVAAGVALAWLVILVLHDWPTITSIESANASSLWPSAGHRSRIRILIKQSLPTGMSAGLTSVCANIPRYTVNAVLGVHALGVFSAAWQLIIAVGIISNTVGQATVPSMATAFADSDAKTFVRLWSRLAAICAGMATIGALALTPVAAEILSFVYGQPAASGATLLIIMAFGSPFSLAGSMSNYALGATRDFGAQTRITAAVTLFAFISCGLLTYWLGAIGAALGWSITAAAQLCLLSVVILSKIKGLRPVLRAA